MSDKIQIVAHVYQSCIKWAVEDPGVARKVTTLGPDMKPQETWLPGPRAKVGILGSRAVRITELGEIQVHIHRNNPNAAHHTWLKIYPSWGKRVIRGQTVEVLTGLLDERGGSLSWVMLDDQLELAQP